MNNPVKFIDTTGHWPEWLDFLMGMAYQYSNNMTLGTVENVAASYGVCMDCNQSEAYREGQQAGQVASIVVGTAEEVAGAAAFAYALAAIPPTIGGGLVCSGFTAAVCALPAGGALALELTIAAAGGAVAGHGVAVVAYAKGGNDSNQSNGKKIWLSKEKAKQAPKRGWKSNDIREVVEHPALTRSTQDNPKVYNRANGHSVTYYYREDGHYVVVDDISGEVIQVSNTNDPEWIDEMTGEPIKPIDK